MYGSFPKPSCVALFELDELFSEYPATKPDVNRLRQLLNSLSDDETRNRWIIGSEVLLRASVSGHTDVVDCILYSLSTPNVRYQLILDSTWLDFTSLRWAALNGRTETVECILDSVTSEQQMNLLNMHRMNETQLDYSVCNGKHDTAEWIRVRFNNLQEAQQRQAHVIEDDESEEVQDMSLRDIHEKMTEMDGELAAIDCELLERDEKIRQLEDAMSAVKYETDDKLAALGFELTAKDEKIRQLEQNAATDKNEFNGKLEERDGKIRQLEETAAVQSAAIHGLTVTNTELTKLQQQQSQEICVLQHTMREMKDEKTARDMEIGQVKESTEFQNDVMKDLWRENQALKRQLQGVGEDVEYLNQHVPGVDPQLVAEY